MIALIRRRFLRLLAGFGGAIAVGGAFAPPKAQAQAPKKQEGKPEDKGSDKGQEQKAKEQKKGGSLLEDERLKNERLARAIVERHAKG